MLQEAVRETVPLWQQVQARALEALPAVSASLLVIGLGVLFGWLAGRIVTRLMGARAAEWPASPLGLGGSLGAWSRPRVIARSVQWFIIFCSSIVALYALDPRLASSLAERVLLYVPRLASAVLILTGGSLLSRFAGRSVLIAAVNYEIGQARLLASLTRTALVVLTVAIALEHSGIGQRTVLVAFAIFFGGLTLAGAIAFGLALQEPLRRWLAEQDARARKAHDEDTLHHV